MPERRSVLVVAQPSPLRDSLTTLLLTLPLISTVRHAGDAATALQLIDTLQPVVVVLDASLPGGDAWTLLRRIKGHRLTTTCLVLTDTTRVRRRAKAAGAHEVLLKGFPAAKLSVVLEQLIQQTS